MESAIRNLPTNSKNYIDSSNQNDFDYIKSFSSLVLDQLNTQDMKALLNSQYQILKRLDDSNKLLLKTNQTSTETFNTFATKDFQSYINLLNRMKQDLDYIFKRIRFLKIRLEKKYPIEYANAFKIVQENNKNLGLDDFDEEEELSVPVNESEVLNQERERTGSNISSGSKLSASKSVFANFFESARSRISPSLNKDASDISNTSFVNTNQSIQNSTILEFAQEEIRSDENEIENKSELKNE